MLAHARQERGKVDAFLRPRSWRAWLPQFQAHALGERGYPNSKPTLLASVATLALTKHEYLFIIRVCRDSVKYEFRNFLNALDVYGIDEKLSGSALWGGDVDK